MCPNAHQTTVTGIFDSFAASFEAKLENLSYRAPALVATMLEDSGREPKEPGCTRCRMRNGTMRPAIAPFARRFAGVDLSEGMLERAREKNVYDALVKAELTEYFRGNSGAFDLIVSADTLVYFGDLKGVVAAAARALRPNGKLVFTLEDAAGTAPASTIGSNCTAAIVTLRPTSRNWSCPPACSRRSSKPSCAWRQECRSPAWSFVQQNRRPPRSGRGDRAKRRPVPTECMARPRSASGLMPVGRKQSAAMYSAHERSPWP